LDPVIVCASEGFASSCNEKSEIPYKVVVGEHFGTVHRGDVEDGPPPDYDDVADPVQLLRLWVFDTWVGDIDRDTNGNVLLAIANSGKFDVIAADQSDCFCGAETFCSGDFEKRMSRYGKAESVGFLARIIFQHGGPSAIRSTIDEVMQCLKHIPEVISSVPKKWWEVSRIDPTTVEEALIRRADRLEDILKPSEWGIPDASEATLL
jgi:hypothetical protein